MPADFLAWSFSRIKDFRSCPKKIYHTAILKKWDAGYIGYTESPQQAAGKEIDEAFTKRTQDKTPLPAKFAQWEPLMAAIDAAPGTKFAQLPLAFDRMMNPCGTKDWNNTWLRCVLDLVIVNGAHAFIWDYKNGKLYLDEDQLKLFAAAGFLYFPEVDIIDTSYVWLTQNAHSDRTYRRRELPDLLNYFAPDVERMQIAFKTNNWPATPEVAGNFGCGYCSVNRAGLCPVAKVKYKGS